MRTLHELPRFCDRWAYLYLERGRLDQDASGLVFHTAAGDSVFLTRVGVNRTYQAI